MKPENIETEPQDEDFYKKSRETRMIEFQREIEAMKDPTTSYIDVIAEYCELHDLDTESVKELISPALRARIHRECAKLRMIKVDSYSI